MSSAVRVLVPLNLIPLQQAVLCANCEVVSESKNGHCVVCGSPSLVNLARVLDGPNRGENGMGAHTSSFAANRGCPPKRARARVTS
jgi:hypothetical protein